MLVNDSTNRILVVLIFVLLSISCQKQENDKSFDKNFVHTVYFWLNEPNNQEIRSAFETSMNTFMKTSKYAKTKFIGVPANTPRDVVDNTYTYTLVLTFGSKKDQDLYQKEEAHLLFIKEVSDLLNKVQVYDAVPVQ